ncbi:MAG: hypothetical protein AAF518_06470 [Spirochaetota bacterium]
MKTPKNTKFKPFASLFQLSKPDTNANDEIPLPEQTNPLNNQSANQIYPKQN